MSDAHPRRAQPCPAPRPMRRVLAPGLLALALSVAAPAALARTGALHPEPLVDRPPVLGAVPDRVLHGRQARRVARAAAALPSASYPTGEGFDIPVQFADGYARDDQVAQTYVTFLAGLPHGSELRRLTVRIAPPRGSTPTAGAARATGSSPATPRTP